MACPDMEDGEYVSDHESLGSISEQDKSDCDSDGSEENMAQNSLFDALAAAQEASEKYSGKTPQVNDGHRLPDGFLCDAFTCAISKTWKKDECDGMEDDDDEKVDWKVGDKCSALYDEDGFYYLAKVIRVKDWKNASVVRFTEYGNEEEVLFSNMKEIEKRETKKNKKRPVKKKRKIRVRNDKARENSSMPV